MVPELGFKPKTAWLRILCSLLFIITASLTLSKPSHPKCPFRFSLQICGLDCGVITDTPLDGYGN